MLSWGRDHHSPGSGVHIRSARLRVAATRGPGMVTTGVIPREGPRMAVHMRPDNQAGPRGIIFPEKKIINWV